MHNGPANLAGLFLKFRLFFHGIYLFGNTPGLCIFSFVGALLVLTIMRETAGKESPVDKCDD